MFPNVKHEFINKENVTKIPTALSLCLCDEDGLYAKASELISLFLPRYSFEKGGEDAI
jgi:hypothetical protein